MTSTRYNEMIARYEKDKALREKALEMIDEVQQMYRTACVYDNMPGDTKFAVFSDSNPHAKEYNRLMKEYLAFIKNLPNLLP